MSERSDGSDLPLQRTAIDEVVSESEAIEEAVESLEAWLIDGAEAGVPELVLIGVLRAYAAEVEARGFVPRAWVSNGGSE